jgi:hypothetical protein
VFVLTAAALLGALGVTSLRGWMGARRRSRLGVVRGLRSRTSARGRDVHEHAGPRCGALPPPLAALPLVRRARKSCGAHAARHRFAHGAEHCDLTAVQLLLSGAVVWLTNVIVFGLWFWTLDSGGPLRRAVAGRRMPDFSSLRTRIRIWPGRGGIRDSRTTCTSPSRTGSLSARRMPCP